MTTVKTCFHCGSSRLEAGRVQSTGLLNFRPANPRIITARTADIQVFANMCLDCGAIDLEGDLKKARKLTKQQ